MMFLWRELHNDVLPKQGLWHQSHTDGRLHFWDLVNKWEVAKGLERCKGEINFLEVFEATEVLVSFERFLKSKLRILGESEITL